jgi:hypothetical protein
MNRFRVVTVQWIDVDAHTVDDARTRAASVFYGASESERISFPSVLHVVDFDGDGVDAWPMVDDVLSVIMNDSTWERQDADDAH